MRDNVADIDVITAAMHLGAEFEMSSRACRDNARWKAVTREEARAVVLGLGVRWRIDVSDESRVDESGKQLHGWTISSAPRGTTAIRFSAPDQDSIAQMSMAVNEQHLLAAAVAPQTGDAPKAGKSRRCRRRSCRVEAESSLFAMGPKNGSHPTHLLAVLARCPNSEANKRRGDRLSTARWPSKAAVTLRQRLGTLSRQEASSSRSCIRQSLSTPA